MAVRYVQNIAKSCQIRASANPPFKRPLHEGYIRNLSNTPPRMPTRAFLFPLLQPLANPWWWDDLGITPFHPTIDPKVHIPGHQPLHFLQHHCCAMVLGIIVCPPLYFKRTPPLHRTPCRLPPWGDVQGEGKPIHFMRNKGWENVIDACLQHPSVRQHQVAGGSWESVCKTWWENFACICVFA